MFLTYFLLPSRSSWTFAVLICRLISIHDGCCSHSRRLLSTCSCATLLAWRFLGALRPPGTAILYGVLRYSYFEVEGRLGPRSLTNFSRDYPIILVMIMAASYTLFHKSKSSSRVHVTVFYHLFSLQLLLYFITSLFTIYLPLDEYTL